MSVCDDVTRIGPFNDGEKIAFMGGTVIDLQSSIGWNGGVSQVNIRVVEDCYEAFTGRLGNEINQSAIGTPQDITVGGFYFAGIIQMIEKVEDFGGFPTYRVVLISPTGLLEGTQLIIGAYNGSIKFNGRRIPNLLNIFGYLEAGVFGFSGVNDGGCYWQYTNSTTGVTLGVKPAIEALTGYTSVVPPFVNYNVNDPTETEIYGGYLEWKGNYYKVNLTNVPHYGSLDTTRDAPIYYRIPNQTVSLLEAISQVCRDGGFEFFVNLTLDKDTDGRITTGPHEISIETISRREQPQLGEVNTYIQNNTKYRSSSSQGMEFRDDYVSAFLLGSMMEELAIITDDTKIKQFWGYDQNGVPIFGESDSHDFPVGEEGNTVTVNFQRMILNASSIEDILDESTYTCTDIEMMCALGSMEAWTQFKGIATDSKFGSRPLFIEDLPLIYDVVGRRYKDFYDRLNTRDENRVLPFDAVDENKIKENTQKLYEFVKSYAEQYYGKKYLLALNNVSIKIDSDTNERQYSHGIIQSAYIGDGGRPLDITTTNAILFMDQTNRFSALARTPVTPQNFYFANKNPESSVTESSSTGYNIYHMLSVGDSFIDYEIDGNKLWVEVTLDDCPFENPTHPWGDTSILRALLKLEEDQMPDLIASQESFKMLVHPRPIPCNGFAIPLRNNTVVYGPWGQFPDVGVAGRCYLEIDDSLNPWTYEIGLNIVAQQKIQNAITNLQVVENGVIEVAGTPDKSLGRSLTDGGNLYLTGVDINYAIGGVTTVYRIQTYTPRFGVFSFGNADRLRRITDASAKQRRALREQIRKKKQANPSPGTAITTGLWRNAMESFYMASPKNILVSELIEDEDNERFYSTVSLTTAKEALAILPKENEKYRRFAVSSLDSVFAPVRIGDCDSDAEGDDAGVIPCRDLVTNDLAKRRLSIWGNPKVDQRDETNVFYRNGDDSSGTTGRSGYAVGLRSPMMLSGWAMSAFKKDVCLPNENENIEDKDISNADDCDGSYIRDESKSKSGPFEVFWDHKRGVFCSPGFVLVGTVRSTSPLKVKVNSPDLNEDEIEVISPLGSVEEDQTVAMMRNLDGYWVIIAASCSS